MRILRLKTGTIFRQSRRFSVIGSPAAKVKSKPIPLVSFNIDNDEILRCCFGYLRYRNRQSLRVPYIWRASSDLASFLNICISAVRSLAQIRRIRGFNSLAKVSCDDNSVYFHSRQRADHFKYKQIGKISANEPRMWCECAEKISQMDRRNIHPVWTSIMYKQRTDLDSFVARYLSRLSRIQFPLEPRIRG